MKPPTTQLQLHVQLHSQSGEVSQVNLRAALPFRDYIAEFKLSLRVMLVRRSLKPPPSFLGVLADTLAAVVASIKAELNKLVAPFGRLACSYHFSATKSISPFGRLGGS